MIGDLPAGFDRRRYHAALPLRALASFSRSGYGGSMLRCLLLPVGDQPVSFVIGNEGALDALGFASISREIEHIATAQQALGATHIHNGARANLKAHHKRDACRENGFE